MKKGKEKAFDDDDDDAEPTHVAVSRTEKVSTMVYDAEQAELRRAFKRATDDADDEEDFLKPVQDDDDDDDDDGDLAKYVDKAEKSIVAKLDKKEKEDLKSYVRLPRVPSAMCEWCCARVAMYGTGVVCVFGLG